ncbi:MAG: carbamoyltransferase HypF [Bacteroidia bacterium]|nr:carbamoyltransferase HypF [Bacteroidia bacterium]
MTWHLHLKGQVQGVGFRPYVRRMAQIHQLHGWVANTSDGVHIEVNADAGAAHDFLTTLVAGAPRLSHITDTALYQVADVLFSGFYIRDSHAPAEADLLLAPDFATCEACHQELQQPADRRYAYGFITCTDCGPRFSISAGLPYDRARTSMAAFQMCDDCQAEYHNVDDRRYFSQTNSCPACGIQLRMVPPADNPPVEAAIESLLQGQIVALKGIGGYLLLCDATDAHAIQRLRDRKHRPTKPLAVLYPNLTLLEADVILTPASRRLLSGPAAPLVLLPARTVSGTGLCRELIAPALDQIGAMLPYAPLLAQVAAGVNRPLVATSANLSGSPIYYQDESALADLPAIADRILVHTREILVPQDDSVVHPGAGGPATVIRRARGYAPTFFPPRPVRAVSVLALGAQLKGTFTWTHRGNVYISPYLGDLDHPDTQLRFEQMVAHIGRLLGASPDILVADRHPDYFTTQLAKSWADRAGIPLHQVQHHHAHAAAIVDEHALWESPDPVLVFVWDGTGLGDHGEIWGGECFRLETGHLTRTAHLPGFSWLLGDKMAREPRLSALSLCQDLPEAAPILQRAFTEPEWTLYQRLLRQPQSVTFSTGRLFDGVAALLGLGYRISYEGEAAMRLEALARTWLHKTASLPHPYPPGDTVAALMRPILDDLLQGVPTGEIAARFHLMLVAWISQVAETHGCNHLAFSGGVFQNALLTTLITRQLADTHRLYFHRQLSPNDESVSYGQMAFVSNIL